MAKSDLDSQKLISIYQVYKQEAEAARFSRLEQNKINFDAYHLRQDFSEKIEGQSTEFLPKLSMAVEQGANYLQQGLIDMGDWFRAEPAPGITSDMMAIKPSTIQKLLTRQLERSKFMMRVGDAAKLGMLGSLMIAKVGGKWVNKPKYVAETKMVGGKYVKKLVKIEDKKWELRIDLIQQEDFRIDPTCRGLYEMQDVWMDYYEVEALAKGKDAIYDLSVVKELKAMGTTSQGQRELTLSRETAQNTSHNMNRKQIKITEIWGNFVDENGELIWENCVATIANDQWVIQAPTPNPYWHGESPFVAVPMLTVPGSVWGKALMDAPASLNMAINELFNLMLDGGLMSVHGIKQIRADWLENPEQIENGIAPGVTLNITSAVPAGAQVLERVDTATIPADAINMYNLTNQEFVTAALTSDLRMGVQSARAVKATEVVESSQAITSMFTGLAKHIESNWVKLVLEKAWKTCAQHMDDFDTNELAALVGRQTAAQLEQMGPEGIFADTVQSCAFEVFGISANLTKQKDFTKLQAMLQTIASVPTLTEAFMKQYDLSKLLNEIMLSLDINTARIEADDAKEGAGPDPTQGQGGQNGTLPDQQSQIPQAGSANSQPADQVQSAAQPQQGSAINAPQFPGSKATPRGSGQV